MSGSRVVLTFTVMDTAVASDELLIVDEEGRIT